MSESCCVQSQACRTGWSRGNCLTCVSGSIWSVDNNCRLYGVSNWSVFLPQREQFKVSARPPGSGPSCHITAWWVEEWTPVFFHKEWISVMERGGGQEGTWVAERCDEREEEKRGGKESLWHQPYLRKFSRWIQSLIYIHEACDGCISWEEQMA